MHIPNSQENYSRKPPDLIMEGSPDTAGSPASAPGSLARHACASCKQRKRKCDRVLPACAMCKKKVLKCEYTVATSPSTSSTFSNEQYNAVQEPQDFANKFPAVYFLDAETFHRGHLEIPKMLIPIPRYVRELIGDDGEIRLMASKFFNTIHTYFPIISKQRFYSTLLNPLSQPRPDVALLVLCMRLTTMSDKDRHDVPVAKTPEYFAAKRFYTTVEGAGTCSTQVLQSGVLIAFYEFGHAIYPAANFSVGACARYGVSYGMNLDEYSASEALNWIEVEEKKRVWWAVLILDRCITLGNPTRALATQEPPPSTCLPIEDDTWDRGLMPLNDVFTVSSPTTLRMGRFGRFAQATYLLGRVLKHVSDRTTDAEFLDEEATQLRRTLHALVTLVKVESLNTRAEFCTQSSICWAGLLLLQGSYGHLTRDIALLSEEENIAEGVAKEIEIIARLYLAHADDARIEKVSPFMHHTLYHSTSIWTEDYRRTGSRDSFEAANKVHKMMSILGARWKAGEAYLEILRARELTQFY